MPEKVAKFSFEGTIKPLLLHVHRGTRPKSCGRDGMRCTAVYALPSRETSCPSQVTRASSQGDDQNRYEGVCWFGNHILPLLGPVFTSVRGELSGRKRTSPTKSRSLRNFSVYLYGRSAFMGRCLKPSLTSCSSLVQTYERPKSKIRFRQRRLRGLSPISFRDKPLPKACRGVQQLWSSGKRQSPARLRLCDARQ